MCFQFTRFFRAKVAALPAWLGVIPHASGGGSTRSGDRRLGSPDHRSWVRPRRARRPTPRRDRRRRYGTCRPGSLRVPSSSASRRCCSTAGGASWSTRKPAPVPEAAYCGRRGSPRNCRMSKAVKWNSPLYGIEDQGWFLGIHTMTRTSPSRRRAPSLRVHPRQAVHSHRGCIESDSENSMCRKGLQPGLEWLWRS